MLQLQHLVPPGHKDIVPGVSSKVQGFMPKLIEKVGEAWTPIPESDLDTFLQIKEMTPCHAFRKNKKEVYIHVFGFEGCDNFKALNIVIGIYGKYKLGFPKFPTQGNWMHTIPIPGPTLTTSENLLIHQIAHSLFWTVYMDFNKNVLKRK